VKGVPGAGEAWFKGIALAVIALMTAAPLLALWSAWLDRSIAAWEAALLLTGVLWLAWSAAAGLQGDPLRTVVSLGTMFAAWGLGAQLSRRTDRAILRGLIEEDMDRAHELLARNENDPIAHTVLGDCYRKLGRLHDAIAEYEAALAIVANMPDVKAKLVAVQREREEREERKERCLECGKMIYRGAPVCPECGAARRRGWAAAEMVREGALFTLFKWLTITGLVIVTLIAIARRWPDASFYMMFLGAMGLAVAIIIERFRGTSLPRV
jgi:tetratricopeptide (TPR) repeat protein